MRPLYHAANVAVLFLIACVQRGSTFSPSLSPRQHVIFAPSDRINSVSSPVVDSHGQKLFRRPMTNAAAAEADESSGMEAFRKYAQIFCNLFPIWTLLTAATALKVPSVYLGIPPSSFPAQIGLLMLCMGISLKPADFQRVFQRPGEFIASVLGISMTSLLLFLNYAIVLIPCSDSAAVLLAFVGCYGVMPSLAIVIGKAFTLEPPLAAGLVLVACINGAQ